MCYTRKIQKEIESVLNLYGMVNRISKAKRNTLIGDFEKGGLKMIDIESYCISLMAIWVCGLTDSNI